jgi:hypothetical protein
MTVLTLENIDLSTRRLSDCEEARGQLLQVLEQNGFVIAVFSWGAVSLPDEFAARLRDLVGCKVGILNLCGYRLRAL